MTMDRAARVMSAGALATSVIALFKGQPVGAAENLGLDQATKDLLALMAQNGADTLDALNELIIQGVKVDVSGQNSISVVVPNAPGGITLLMIIRNAGVPVQIPSYKIPDGFQVLFMSHPTLNPAGSIISVAFDPNSVLNNGWPLIPGSTIGYKIKDTSVIYLSSNIPNLTLCMTAEYGG